MSYGAHKRRRQILADGDLIISHQVLINIVIQRNMDELDGILLNNRDGEWDVISFAILTRKKNVIVFKGFLN